jgi:hypothetical protein
MLNRYQTGPFITLLAFVIALVIIAFDIFDALHFHHWGGWINAAIILLLLFRFDRRYKRGAE